jgi:quercetin dioxygenase-like cupin family protein
MIFPKEAAQRGVTSDGRELLIRAGTADTNGRMRVVEMSERFRPRVPVHTHGYDEAWYILAGTYAILSAGTWAAAQAGSFAFVPAGTPHAVAALPGPECAKVSLLLAPAPDPDYDKYGFAFAASRTAAVPWRSVLAGRRPAESEPDTPDLESAIADSLAGRPHLFDVEFALAPPSFVMAPDGAARMIVHATGGSFTGDGLAGRVQATTDWAHRDPAGAVGTDLRAHLACDDGSPLLLELTGLGIREAGGLVIWARGTLRASAGTAGGWLDSLPVLARGRQVEGGVAYAVHQATLS